MVKARSQMEVIKRLMAADFCDFDNTAITVQYSPFALCGTDEIHAIAGPGALIAHFKPSVLRKVWKNAKDARCYVVAMANHEVYDGAYALIMEIPPRAELDGTSRPVYYGSLIGQLVSGEVNVHRVERHPKRKAKKVPALGFFDGTFKFKAVAPKKTKESPRRFLGYRQDTNAGPDR